VKNKYLITDSPSHALIFVQNMAIEICSSTGDDGDDDDDDELKSPHRHSRHTLSWRSESAYTLCCSPCAKLSYIALNSNALPTNTTQPMKQLHESCTSTDVTTIPYRYHG